MTSSYVSAIKPALIMFVDIVDSSVYSSILGIKRFGEKVLLFQELFRDLGNKYFYNRPCFVEKVDSLCNVDSRGDEGFVFIVDPRQSGQDLVHHAVKFALELKARLKILNLKKQDLKEQDLPPREMKIAAGIHYGEVALVTTSELKEGIYRSFLDRIEGYSINYAKRVESSSRIGRFSQVFLSKEAADLLSNSPIVLCRYEASLRGIQQNDEVYEVRSAFLDELPLPVSDGAGGIENEQFLDFFTKELDTAEFLREPWLKSFALSVLNSRKEAVSGTAIEKEYGDRISEMAWRKLTEDDPIMLYWRARECETSGKYSRAVTCLRNILKEYPYFIQARIKIIEACHKMIETEDKIPSEMLFVRDTAEELLEKYERILLEGEKRQLNDILDTVNKRIVMQGHQKEKKDKEKGLNIIPS